MRPEFHPLKVASLQHEGQAVIVGLEVPLALREAYAFRAGQYLTLRAMQGDVELRRPYSICSAQGDAALRVGIRRVANGAFSSGIAPRLRVGDTLDVLMPQGRFVLPPAKGPRHVLGIAAGSGITPVLSILATALRHEPDTRCTLILGNRQFESVMLRSELDALKDRYLARFALHHVFSRGPRDDALPSDADDALFHGRLDTQRLTALVRAVAPLTDGDEAVVCGPSGVITAAQTALANIGLGADYIHIERFGSDESPSLAAARAESVDALTNSAEASACAPRARHRCWKAKSACSATKRSHRPRWRKGLCCAARRNRSAHASHSRWMRAEHGQHVWPPKHCHDPPAQQHAHCRLAYSRPLCANAP